MWVQLPPLPLDKTSNTRYNTTMKIQLSDIPTDGTYKKNDIEYSWQRSPGFPNSLFLFKEAVAENPPYEAAITCPDGILDLDDHSPDNITVCALHSNGGETDLGANWIDQFDSLIEHFRALATNSALDKIAALDEELGLS